MQLESAFQTNKKKQTADQVFGNDYFDYIYGIVTTGTEWHFIIYTPDSIYSTSGSEYQINLTKSAVKENPELGWAKKIFRFSGHKILKLTRSPGFFFIYINFCYIISADCKNGT